MLINSGVGNAIAEIATGAVAQTLKTWTVLETILSVTGLVLALVLNVIV